MGKKETKDNSLDNFSVMTTIAVHDLENAKDFYETVLGLELIERNNEGIVFGSGGGRIAIYESTAAGTSQSTVAWWKVNNVEETVKELKTKGIAFEKKYDMPHAKRKGDVYITGSTLSAWFRDPDGNILGIGNY